MTIGQRIARFLAPEDYEAIAKERSAIDLAVNNRVADVLFKMDPFEPLLKKYNVIFSEEWTHPEDKLDYPSQLRLYMWAYGMEKDPNFLHLTEWIQNTQGNNTLRKASHHDEWLYGRAALATITLFVEEVGRLASRYREVIANKDRPFDVSLAVE